MSGEYMKKNKGLLISGIGLTIVVILCIITAAGTLSWFPSEEISFEFFSVDHISAEVTESFTFQSQEIENIEITSNGGDITILPGNPDQILVDLIKTGWGGTQKEALQKAEGLEMTWKEVGDTLYLTFNRPNKIQVITYQGGSNKIDMTLNIPSNIHVVANSNDGDIFAEDIDGSLDLEGRFGDIFITNITGELTAINRDGDISINNLTAAQNDVIIETQFGDIETNEINSENTKLSSRDGNIEINDISSSETLEISTEFGNISLKNFSCEDLAIKARDGKSELQSGNVSNILSVDSKFGDIKVTDVIADNYIIEARDGDVDITNAEGIVTANSRFGNIDIVNGSNITLSATLEDGKITFIGLLNPASNHNIKTRFGDVNLTIPVDSDFDLHAETKFGLFKSEIPINITIGPDAPLSNDNNENRWEGQMNNGGSLITITTEDGDINLTSLDTK
jgi:DUF4097 and DUF4098 domain-containing protein YvlB